MQISLVVFSLLVRPSPREHVMWFFFELCKPTFDLITDCLIDSPGYAFIGQNWDKHASRAPSSLLTLMMTMIMMMNYNDHQLCEIYPTHADRFFTRPPMFPSVFLSFLLLPPPPPSSSSSSSSSPFFFLFLMLSGKVNVFYLTTERCAENVHHSIL